MSVVIKPKILNRAVTRDLPLFMISASYGEHLQSATMHSLAFKLSRNFILFDRGTAVIHRDNEEWFNIMPGLWATALQDKKRSDAIRDFIRGTYKSIDKLNYLTVTPDVTCLVKLRHVIADGVAGMIFAHWLPIYNEQKLARYKPNDLEYFEQSRKETEKFFGLAADVAYEFLALVSAKYDIDTNLLKYATDDELRLLLTSSEINTTILQKRKVEKLLFVEDITYLGDGEINAYLKENGYVLDRPPTDIVTSIQGNVACRGIARGPVQVITSREQFDSFNVGSILVAPMTTPEYALIINKAIAIITDEGGLLSHAAIISRELNKPCVIGTKSASYILKDFQEIEVDANRGFVRVLL